MTKILLLAGILDSGDVPFLLKKTFENLGCKVEFVPVDEELPFLENAFYKNGLRFSRRFLTLFSRRIYKMAKGFNPDIFFVYGSNWAILPETLGKIKKKIGCKIVLWEGNIQFWRWFQGEALEYYDHCFVSDSYIIPILKGPARVKNVHLLGGIADPEVHRPLKLSSEDYERFGADVSFIGMAHSNRIKLLEQLTQYNLKIWGKKWQESRILEEYFIPEPVQMLKKIKIYNASKICLNIQSEVCQVDGVSSKIFEILSCGGFLVTEAKKDLSLYFKVGEEIITFSGIDDLKRKINYYLLHPEEREEIARRGQKRVLAEYTYKHRVKEILETCSQC